MPNLHNQKVAAVVPALNEETTVGDVLKVLLSHENLTDIILVDDGSTDKTAEIGEELGVKVLKLIKNSGKGNAMRQGVLATEADIIIFLDADLIGLTREHISLLIDPLLENGIDMCIGVRERIFGLPKFFAKMDFITAIGGERAVKRNIFLDIPEKLMQGFAVETALNYFCFKNNRKVSYAQLENINVVIKEKKWGFWKGFSNRIKMIFEIIKIRIKLYLIKNEHI